VAINRGPAPRYFTTLLVPVGLLATPPKISQSK
jgi:hypothetical protein